MRSHGEGVRAPHRAVCGDHAAREDVGNLTVDPNPVPVTTGEATTAELAWSGLTEGTWKGLVTWDAGVTTDVTVTVP